MTNSPTNAEPVKLVDALHAIRRRLRYVLGLSVVIVIALSRLILAEEPVYRAYVTLASVPRMVNPVQPVSADALLGIGGSSGADIFQAQISEDHAFEILRSDDMSRRFIESEKLLPVLFADEWDAASQTWRDADADQHPTLEDALELFESEVRFISKNRATGVIRINIEWSDPELAALWANGLVKMADEEIRKRDIEESNRSIAYLESRADAVALDSEKSLIYKLIESHAKTIMLASVRDNYAFSILDPAVPPRLEDAINMPKSFKFSMAIVFALGFSFFLVVGTSITLGRTK